MLWALDDFTPENGGTQMIPYSHRSTMYMRENGREFLEGNYDPNDVLKLRMPRGSVLLFAGERHLYFQSRCYLWSSPLAAGPTWATTSEWFPDDVQAA
jgi:hypothetical protein